MRRKGTAEWKIESYGRFWAVYDEAGNLICVTVYKKGAAEVVRRLATIKAVR